MARGVICALVALCLVPQLAAGQGSAYDDALGSAISSYSAGRLSEAEAGLSQLIVLVPYDPRPYYFRGLCAWQAGRAADAGRDFARGAELEQQSPARLAEVGQVLLRVQGPARRVLESYRGPVRLAQWRQRDAQRLARYGIATAPPAEQLASAAATHAADTLPMPRAPAAAGGSEPKGAEDPFAAPATETKGAAATDPFAAPAVADKKPVGAADPFAAPAAPAEAPAAAMSAAAPAAGSAPASEPATAAAPAAAAASGEATPDGTVKAAIAALEQPQNLWALLPASYQNDAKELVSAFAGKMDPELWDRSFAVVRKLVQVGKDKRDLIVKQPLVAAIAAGVGSEKFNQQWDQALGMLGTLLTSEIGTSQGLKTLDPAAFLAGAGGDAIKLMASGPGSINTTMGSFTMAELKAAKITTTKSEGDTATVSLSIGEKPPVEFEMKRVDGKWLPAKMVDDWAADMAAAKQKLDAMDVAATKPQAMMMLQMADGVLDQLLAAKDEAAFNAALGPIIALASQFGGGLPGGAPGGPPSLGPAGPGAPPPTISQSVPMQPPAAPPAAGSK